MTPDEFFAEVARAFGFLSTHGFKMGPRRSGERAWSIEFNRRSIGIDVELDRVEQTVSVYFRDRTTHLPVSLQERYSLDWLKSGSPEATFDASSEAGGLARAVGRAALAVEKEGELLGGSVARLRVARSNTRAHGLPLLQRFAPWRVISALMDQGRRRG